jgi:cell wall-associated NlpC family hydrolase
MTSPSHLRLPRLRSGVRKVAVVAASFGAVATFTAFDAGSASAQELPTNALAPNITSSARTALAALDAYEANGTDADELELTWHRSITAAFTARQLGYDESDMIETWATTSLARQRVVLSALTQIGVPYRYNTSSEGVGFDCSGFTSFAWGQAGRDLVRQSSGQISSAQRVDRSSARAGDLVHYPGHVMMYLGVGDAIVHSPSTGRTVEVGTMSRSSVSFGDPTHTS